MDIASFIMALRTRLLALLLLPLAAFASDYYDSYGYQPCCRECFHVDVDFLYWDTCLNEVQYAMLFTVPQTGDTLFVEDAHYLRGEWEPGFRVGGSYNNIFCCFDLFGSYTWIRGSDSDSTRSTDLSPVAQMFTPLGINTSGSSALTLLEAKNDYLYQSGDLLFGRDIFLNQCQSIYPFIGAEGIFLSQSLDLAARGDYNVDARWHTRFWGLGLKAGLRYLFPIFDCLDFFAKGSASILGGCAQTKLREGDPTGVLVPVNFRKTEVQAVPGAHLQLGLTYDERIFGCGVTLAFGWEFLTWWQKAPQWNTFFINNFDGRDFFIPYALPSQMRDVTFQGLFLRAGVGF